MVTDVTPAGVPKHNRSKGHGPVKLACHYIIMTTRWHLLSGPQPI